MITLPSGSAAKILLPQAICIAKQPFSRGDRICYIHDFQRTGRKRQTDIWAVSGEMSTHKRVRATKIVLLLGNHRS